MVLVLAGLHQIMWGMPLVVFPNLLGWLWGVSWETMSWLVRLWGLATVFWGILLLMSAYRPLAYAWVLVMHVAYRIGVTTLLLLEYTAGNLSAAVLPSVCANELIWIGLLYWVLRQMFAVDFKSQGHEDENIQACLLRVSPESAQDLWQKNFTKPVFFFFMPQGGSVFFAKFLFHIKSYQKSTAALDYTLVLVHMGPTSRLEKLQKTFGLSFEHEISDPGRYFYRFVGVGRGTFMQWYGPKALFALFFRGDLFRYGCGFPSGDIWQMPGVAMLEKGNMRVLWQARSMGDPIPATLSELSASS